MSLIKGVGCYNGLLKLNDTKFNMFINLSSTIKFIPLPVLAILISGNLYAQVKVHGQIKGAANQDIQLLVKRYPNPFEQTTLNGKTDRNGNFLFTIDDLNAITEGSLCYKKGYVQSQIPIEGKNSIRVQIADQVVYQSENVDYMNILHEYENRFSEFNTQASVCTDIDPKHFVPLMDSLTRLKTEYISDKNKTLKNKDLLNKIYQDAYYTASFFKLKNYQFYYLNANKTSKRLPIEKVFENYPLFIDDNALVSDYYISAIYNYISFIKQPIFYELFMHNLYSETNKKTLISNYESESFRDYHVARIILTGKTKDYVTAQILYNNLSKLGIDDVEPIYYAFLQDCKDEYLKQLITKKYDAAKHNKTSISTPTFSLKE